MNSDVASDNSQILMDGGSGGCSEMPLAFHDLRLPPAASHSWAPGVAQLLEPIPA